MKRILVTAGVLIFSVFASVSCVQTPTPTPQAPASAPTLEEKALPPVFTDMAQLWGKYYNSVCFRDGNPQLVFHRLPEQLDAEFAELTLNSALPAVPEKLVAYKVIRPVVDQAYASAMSQRIGFNGPPELYTTDNTYRVYMGDPNNDGSPVISIHQDGTIDLWYDRTRRQPSVLPSDQECLDIARNWLVSRNLYPKDILNTAISPGVVHLMSGWTESQYTYATSISFLMGLDGYELFGMGAHLIIGEQGKVLEVHIDAPEFQPYALVKVQKPQSALATFQDYLRDPDKFRADSPDCLTRQINRYVLINKFTLKYLAMQSPNPALPAYAQPMYVLEGSGRDKPELSWDSFIGAVDAVSK